MAGPKDDAEESPERLLSLIRDVGFTPKVRDVRALARLYEEADEEVASLVDVAFERVGLRAVKALAPVFASYEPRARARVCRVLSKTAAPEVRAFLLAALADADPKTRRNAIIGLGKYEDHEVETALLALVRRSPPLPQLRSLVASLGKVGGPDALVVLRQLNEHDSEFVRIRERAVLMLERTGLRKTPSRVDLSRQAASPTAVLLRCRSGLEELVMLELGRDVESRTVRDGVVEARLRGPLLSLLRVRTALSFSFPFVVSPKRGEWSDSIARAIASDDVRRTLSHWTEGPIRYRLVLDGVGHQRGLVWDVAKKVPELAPELINDPTDSTWEITVHRSVRDLWVEATPRAFDDSRFTYRKGDVPAASHPTIAAALALVARVLPGDIVWDPFAGSGTELIECGLRERRARLFGSDRDAAALATAAENVQAAGLTASLSVRDALDPAPPGVTLIVTNPPLGRRVVREASLGPLLDAFIAHAAVNLVPGGRLVWLAPFADRSRVAGERAGLVLESSRSVDMGGFTAELQVWRR